MSHHCTAWQGPWAAEGSQVLKRVIGRLSVALSEKSSPGMEKHSDRKTHNKLSLSVIFLWLSVKVFFEKGKNLRDLPRLNQEGRGYLTVPAQVGYLLDRPLPVSMTWKSIEPDIHYRWRTFCQIGFDPAKC